MTNDNNVTFSKWLLDNKDVKTGTGFSGNDESEEETDEELEATENREVLAKEHITRSRSVRVPVKVKSLVLGVRPALRQIYLQ
jgi:hypothetical protein